MASNTVINTNIRALNSHRNLGSVANSLQKSSERLSSGKKINRSGDDAAGLAISEKMRAQIKGLDMADKNAQDAISLIQTAEGSLGEIENMLQRMRELVVQASNDTNITEDREKIAEEIEQLQDEIDGMASRSEFNKKGLLNFASGNDNVYFQIGANAGQSIDMDLKTMNTSALGVSSIADCLKAYAKTNAGDDIAGLISDIDDAISEVSSHRSTLGAKQNRLEYTSSNLQISSENLSAAKSRIEDADMAEEMMNVTSNNVLQQAATAMLAQANQATSQVVSLLQ